ncbi:MAG: hypothetical protein CML13_10375 [Puniceicoccaceae bacterium]|nr:hypothetical protein [Puniceicoccaceae bacterium]|tara:strand:- start:477 stop:671 length:195 start_codon:yes stop_codon:yes gene_type:complete
MFDQNENYIIQRIPSKKLKETEKLCPYCSGKIYVRKVALILKDDTHIDSLELYCKACAKVIVED